MVLYYIFIAKLDNPHGAQVTCCRLLTRMIEWVTAVSSNCNNTWHDAVWNSPLNLATDEKPVLKHCILGRILCKTLNCHMTPRFNRADIFNGSKGKPLSDTSHAEVWRELQVNFSVLLWLLAGEQWVGGQWWKWWFHFSIKNLVFLPQVCVFNLCTRTILLVNRM